MATSIAKTLLLYKGFSTKTTFVNIAIHKQLLLWLKL